MRRVDMKERRWLRQDGQTGEIPAGEANHAVPTKGMLPRRRCFCRLLAAAVLCGAVLTLGGCGASKEKLETRKEGIALLESGDYEGAIGKFETLIQSAGRVTDFELDVLKYRAEAEFSLGDYGAAAYTYDILSQVDKECAEYDYLAALCLARDGDVDGAQELLATGKALDPDLEKLGYEAAMMALGEALASQGDEEAAKELYEELITLGRATTETYNRLMLASMEEGQYGEALSAAADGLALSDDTARQSLRFNEAVCYEYLGQYEKALELFRQFVDDFGENEQAEHEIAFLVTR